jgi:hypothetical protein
MWILKSGRLIYNEETQPQLDKVPWDRIFRERFNTKLHCPRMPDSVLRDRGVCGRDAPRAANGPAEDGKGDPEKRSLHSRVAYGKVLGQLQFVFKAKGYDVTAPPWPGKEESVEEQNKNPSPLLETLGIGKLSNTMKTSSGTKKNSRSLSATRWEDSSSRSCSTADRARPASSLPQVRPRESFPIIHLQYGACANHS